MRGTHAPNLGEQRTDTEDRPFEYSELYNLTRSMSSRMTSKRDYLPNRISLCDSLGACVRQS